MSQAQINFKLWGQFWQRVGENGISKDQLRRTWFWQQANWFRQATIKLLDQGWLVVTNGQLHLTKKGWQHVGYDRVPTGLMSQTRSYFVFPASVTTQAGTDCPQVVEQWLADADGNLTTDISDRLEVDSWQQAQQISERTGIGRREIKLLVTSPVINVSDDLQDRVKGYAGMFG